MKHSSRNQLIEYLSTMDQEYISGPELSKILNISRTAVWKHINELKKDGYQFETVHKKGYKLIQTPSHLSESSLQWDLHTKWLGKNLIYKEELGSTQTLAHQLAQDDAPHGTVVITNNQTSGRGRLNRKWESNHSDGIWMSIILRPKLAPYNASQMTLFTAVTLVDTLNTLTNLNVQIKWPNDLFINGKKCCGILTEMQAELDGIQYMVIGIGMNVNQDAHSFSEELLHQATSIRMETGEQWDRKQLITAILDNFEKAYKTYMDNGFSQIKQKWTKNAYKLNEKVHITMSNQSFDATIKGITEDGALLVFSDEEELVRVYSAEINW
ncbi:biotin--[acetyl-CoA-carboxylase] ligase [Gracilibacillus sp. YIM 98692]|uniref:biotin--[acetyl-CoA-carboxylase] ligase n=1 Tax=Gracilibacillus sp. YIM 98692 TaxID=2663532 RepID=UPI0013D65A42|nr:biotin--[acetyl-CoA-carboxylase] ligase [Gracilibacillus sp. YIM 98692]